MLLLCISYAAYVFGLYAIRVLATHGMLVDLRLPRSVERLGSVLAAEGLAEKSSSAEERSWSLLWILTHEIQDDGNQLFAKFCSFLLVFRLNQCYQRYQRGIRDTQALFLHLRGIVLMVSSRRYGWRRRHGHMVGLHLTEILHVVLHGLRGICLLFSASSPDNIVRD